MIKAIEFTHGRVGTKWWQHADYILQGLDPQTANPHDDQRAKLRVLNHTQQHFESIRFDHGCQQDYGKPFPVASADDSTHAIFFDDNLKAKPDAKTDIVAPRGHDSGNLVSTGQLVQVDTIEAIRNENYFIEKIERSLEKKLHPSNRTDRSH